MRNSTMCLLALCVVSFVARSLAQGTYTQIDVPGASSTGIWGINTAGDVVGYYNGGRGFLLSGGVFTNIEVPESLTTYAIGLNNQGKIVGNYRHGNQFSGFLYDIPSHTFTTFRYAPGKDTYANAINDAGTIVGALQKFEANPEVGFVLNGNTYSIIAASHATQTALTAINNSGESMVLATDDSGDLRSFLLEQGNLVKIDKRNNFEPYGLNDLGVITGSYTISGGQAAGFVYQRGVFQSLTFPGATSTVPTAINNSGEVVGFFYDSSGNLHGFTWTPPADASKK